MQKLSSLFLNMLMEVDDTVAARWHERKNFTFCFPSEAFFLGKTNFGFPRGFWKYFSPRKLTSVFPEVFLIYFFGKTNFCVPEVLKNFFPQEN